MTPSGKELTFEMNATRYSFVGSSPAAPAQAGDQPGGQQQQNQPQGDPPAPPAPAQQQQQQQQNSESEVSKAYAKLREAEEREKQAKRELDEIKRNQLPEAERTKSDLEAAQAENKTLKDQLAKFAGEGVARAQGFLDPEAAVAILISRGEDISDKSKAEKALKTLAEEKKHMVGQAPPPSGGPINPQQTTTPVGDAGMNQMIRRQAGRA